MNRLPLGFLASLLALGAAACGSGSSNNNAGGAGGASTSSGSSSGAGAGSTTSSGAGGAGATSTSTSSSGSGGSMPAPTCPPPIQAVDVSQPKTKVGSGTAASCTEQAFSDAVKNGGVITFDCGGPATIPITSQKELPKAGDTTIDGGGLITLDGGGKTRILHFDGGDFRKTKTTVTLQHLTIANAKSTGTMIPQAPPPCSQGYDVDGGGAAILIRDGILHVIDVTFQNGAAASPGPDVAGGGVYGIGSLDVTIVGSRFLGNTASNGGAVGSLFSNLSLYNDVFDKNKATGSGENYIDPKCNVNGGESGNGGNGGAVVMDGGEDFTVNICGCVFTGNVSGGLGGGVFRTPDGPRAITNIDQCTFDGGTATNGGGALYFHHSDLNITASTFSNNTAPGAGAIQADDTNLTLLNDTFTENSATKGLGGAISLFGNGGKITNCTFASNHSDGGSGLFGAALAGGQTFQVDNTIFAGNSSQDCGAPMTCQVSNDTGTSDIQWPMNHLVCNNPDPPCAGGGATTFADPKLGKLADNGGPTKTILPDAGSPAIGVGKNCPKTDQRGQPRKNPTGCTAGAVEVP